MPDCFRYMVELKGKDKKKYIDKAKERFSAMKMRCIKEPNESKLQCNPPKGGLSTETYQIDNQDNLDGYILFSNVDNRV